MFATEENCKKNGENELEYSDCKMRRDECTPPTEYVDLISSRSEVIACLMSTYRAGGYQR